VQRMIDHGPSKGVGGLSGDERLKSGGTEANGVGPITERFRVANPVGSVPAAIEVPPTNEVIPGRSHGPVHPMLDDQLLVLQSRSLGRFAGLQVDCQAMQQALPETESVSSGGRPEEAEKGSSRPQSGIDRERNSK